MEQSSSKSKGKTKNDFHKCFRCVNVPHIHTYQAKSTKKISRLAYDAAKKLDPNYDSLDPEGKLIRTCVRCTSDESVADMEDSVELSGTAFEFFVLMKIREHINNLGLFKNMALEYNSSNTDEKEYDLLISDGGTLRKPRRIILIEVDEKQHYNNEEEFLKDRAKEFYFLNTFRKGPNKQGSKTNKKDGTGNATILRIRVGENGGRDEGGKNLAKGDRCIVKEDTPSGMPGKIIIQNPDLFRKNVDRIIKHIERFFSDNGDFSKSAYINLNNDTGVQDYNVGYQTRYPGMPQRNGNSDGGRSIDFISNRFLSGREYDYGQSRKLSPTSSITDIQESSTPQRNWPTGLPLSRSPAPDTTPDDNSRPTPRNTQRTPSNRSKNTTVSDILNQAILSKTRSKNTSPVSSQSSPTEARGQTTRFDMSSLNKALNNPESMRMIESYAEQSSSKPIDPRQLLNQIFYALEKDNQGRPLIKLGGERKKCEDYSIKELEKLAEDFGIPDKDIKKTKEEMCAEIFKMKARLEANK
jgi:hypothetical protein